MKKDIEITVLMPCLNEVRTVGKCISRALAALESLGAVGEVLIADNGSTDGSREAAAAAGARVIQVEEKGYGSALIKGIESARGRFVILGAADDSYDFGSLKPYVEELRLGFDLVMGDRFSGGIEQDAMPLLHRYLGNPVLSFLGRLWFKSGVRDFHCGMRGFRRDRMLALGLHSPGMEFASEMVVKSALAGYRVTEVPTTLRKDGRDRPPHLRTFRDGWRHLRFLLLHSPRWLFVYPGLLLLFSGLLLEVLIYPRVLSLAGLNLDIHTMLFASAAAVLGLQMVILGVVSRYAAWRQGVLPALPLEVRWLARQRLESFLLAGATLFLLGFGWAAWETWAWIASGFASLEPQSAMRALIPSTTLMVFGGQVFLAGFVLAVLKIGASKEGVAQSRWQVSSAARSA